MNKFTVKSKQRKATWTTVRGAKLVRSAPKRMAAKKPRKRLRARSETMKRRMELYRPMRDAFMFDNNVCQARWNGEQCGLHAEDLHHIHGRVGNLLYYFPWWVALCRKCHERVRTDNIAAVQAAGLLSPLGKWNKQPEGVLFQECVVSWVKPLRVIDFKRGEPPIHHTHIMIPVIAKHTIGVEWLPGCEAMVESVELNEARKAASA